MHDKKEFNKRADENEKKLRKELDESGGLEKNDMLAMMLSAFMTIFPVCAVIVIGLGLLMLWLFGAL